jgi:hypothetical protein
LPGSNGNADYWDLKRNTQVKHDILSSYLLRWASILSGGQGVLDDLRSITLTGSPAGAATAAESRGLLR